MEELLKELGILKTTIIEYPEAGREEQYKKLRELDLQIASDRARSRKEAEKIIISF